MILKYLIFLALVFKSFGAFGQSAEITSFPLIDGAGVAVSDIAGTLTSRAVLVVADANRPATQILLRKLSAAKGDWHGQLIVVIGGSVDDMKAAAGRSEIVGARWFATTAGAAPQVFKLAGSPF